jgi:hypothetical protein
MQQHLLPVTLEATGGTGALDVFALRFVMLGAAGALTLAHSGLESLRPAISGTVWERLYRVTFEKIKFLWRS